MVSPTERCRRPLSLASPLFFLFVAALDIESAIADRSKRKRDYCTHLRSKSVALTWDLHSANSDHSNMSDPLDSMLDLMRRLPPTQIEENVSALVDICPDYADDLLGSVDQPLKIRTDSATGKEYLTCDYNRDGDSYRYV